MILVQVIFAVFRSGLEHTYTQVQNLMIDKHGGFLYLQFVDTMSTEIGFQ